MKRLVFPRMIIPYLISFGFALAYLSMQTMSIYAGDSGELVAAAYTWSIAHPPGYPLYMILGGVVSHALPFFTVPWRMGLLSSIPMALSIYFVWRTVFLLSKSKLDATVSSVIYGFLYPVWLYSIVPEVFGLFSLFSSLLLFIFVQYIETKKQRYLFLLAFLSGLSLTHHHLILLLLFSIGLVCIISRKKLLILKGKRVWKSVALFFLGLCVYIYAPLASSQYPPIDWEHPANLMGFIRLITRASYGTFKVTSGAGESLLDRGLNLLTLWQYIVKDFTFIGIVFLLIGIVTLWKKKRIYGLFFLIYVGCQMFYFFYTGFTLTSDFVLGTLERFFVIPYQVISILIGVGIWGFLDLLKTFWRSNKTGVHIPFMSIKIIVICLSLVIPIQAIKHNYKPLKALQRDTTLEKLADDIFASTPEGGILNLSDDTSVFSVLYAYYVQKKRQDIRFVMFPQFQFSYYISWLKRHYTDIVIPSTPIALTYADYLKEFLQANSPYRPIVSERIDVAVSQHWVPRGLVVMYYPTVEEIPPRDQILAKNISLWNGFQDPLQGVLGIYRHMMMGDVLRYYASKRMTLAQSFLLSGNVAEAQAQTFQALRLTPKSLELFVPYIENLIQEKKCPEAIETLENSMNVFVSQSIYLGLYHRLYETCPDLRSMLEPQEKEYQEYKLKYGEKIEE